MGALAQTGTHGSSDRLRTRRRSPRDPHDPGGTASRRIRRQGARITIACAIASLAGGGLALVWPSFQLQTRIGLALVAVIAAAFYGLALSMPWHRGESRRWPIVASAVEVTLASMAIAVLTLFEGAGAIDGGAAAGLYMVVVALAATRTHLVGARMECRLEEELGRYVSRDVARGILRGKVNLGNPQRRTVTVLFCDLRGFTFLCERETPEDVVHILETFYEAAFAIVEEHGGTINKVLGDGLLALFNAPNHVPGHAAAAADAAGEIMRMMHGLRERGGVWTHLAIGIGLDTGEIIVGPIGSASRAEYTAIGSPVNRAARLQSLADRESRRIILSDATRRALGTRTLVDTIGVVELKGFAAPERVYSLPFRRPRGSGLQIVP